MKNVVDKMKFILSHILLINKHFTVLLIQLNFIYGLSEANKMCIKVTQILYFYKLTLYFAAKSFLLFRLYNKDKK